MIEETISMEEKRKLSKYQTIVKLIILNENGTTQ